MVGPLLSAMAIIISASGSKIVGPFTRIPTYWFVQAQQLFLLTTSPQLLPSFLNHYFMCRFQSLCVVHVARDERRTNQCRHTSSGAFVFGLCFLLSFEKVLFNIIWREKKVEYSRPRIIVHPPYRFHGRDMSHHLVL